MRHGRGGCPFCRGVRVSVTNSLTTQAPRYAALWHPNKNGTLRPSDVVAGSGKKYWWRCPKGPDHEWQARPVTLVRNGTAGCPFCRGLRTSVTNSLASQAPQYAVLWHPTKNGTLTPDGAVAKSGKKCWWRCPKGPDHEWQATPARLVSNGKAGCPFCRGLRASLTNSLATQAPRYAVLWHPTKNGALSPTDAVAGSVKKYWWKCPKAPDHEWRDSPRRVVSRATAGCPFCQLHHRRLSVTNSLAAQAPRYAALWHASKNGSLTPADVLARSLKKFWWKCPKGPDHEWQAASKSLIANAAAGCPFCQGLRVSVTNSLAALFPAKALLWHPTKNGSLTPHDVVAGSQKKRWWKCSRAPDHEWQAAPGSVTGRNNSNCPSCAGQKVSITNSLAALFPEKALLWHPTKNGSLTPHDVVAGSGKNRWWKCPRGSDHEWQAPPERLTKPATKHGCPFCAHNRASVTNSLATLFPEIAALWHLTKNGSLTPADILPFSNKRYWWRCRYNSTHQWTSTAGDRTFLGDSCPYCSLLPRSRVEIYFAFELAYFLGIDPCLQNIRIPTDNIHVDMVLPQWRTALELDGYYWHKSKLEKDSAKIRQLEKHGWTLCRIRETPLDKVGPNDIVVRPFPNVNAVPSLVVEVLHALQARYNLAIDGLERYAKNNVLRNKSAADDYIDRRLSRKVASASNRLALEDPVPF